MTEVHGSGSPVRSRRGPAPLPQHAKSAAQAADHAKLQRAHQVEVLRPEPSTRYRAPDCGQSSEPSSLSAHQASQFRHPYNANINNAYPIPSDGSSTSFDTPTVEREPWIRWDDHIAVGAAGLAGGLFALFLNHGLLNRPDLHKKIPHPRHAIDFPLGGHDHRVVGAGHDLFRFAEARQMLIEGKFEALFRRSYAKATFYRYGGQTFPYDNIPEEAATIALLTYWLANFFSTRSLPIPGWSFLTQNNDGVADFAIAAYRSGLNLRSLLSNFSGVLLTGIMLRLYTYLRQFLDTGRIDPFLWKDVKYQEMCLVAQSINLLMNLGKVAVTKNVSAINPVAIMAVIRHAIPVIRDAQRRRSPIAIMERNRGLLDQRWEELEVLAAEQVKTSDAFGRLVSGPVLEA